MWTSLTQNIVETSNKNTSDTSTNIIKTLTKH